jgi:hypothetical protein
LKPVPERTSWVPPCERRGTRCGSSLRSSSNLIASRNKNDFIDAEAIAEAVTKQNMRFVQIRLPQKLIRTSGNASAQYPLRAFIGFSLSVHSVLAVLL